MSNWWAQRTCTRKKRYPEYNQARDVKQRMAEQGLDVSLLMVYRCDIGDGHYHLGHATGLNRHRLEKRMARSAQRQETSGD